MQAILNKISEKKNLQDVWFGGDADYDNIQTATIDSNSSIGQNNFRNENTNVLWQKQKTQNQKEKTAAGGDRLDSLGWGTIL